MTEESGKEDEWPLIYKYTAEDALRDGLFVKVGVLANAPVYVTSNLYHSGGYDKSSERLWELIDKGIAMLMEQDKEDTEYLRLRVIEKDKIWVAMTGEGLTYMRPEDY